MTSRFFLPVEVEFLPEGVYFAECSMIPGCHAEGDTLPDVLANIQDVARVLLELMREDGRPLPEGLQAVDLSQPVHLQLLVAAEA